MTRRPRTTDRLRWRIADAVNRLPCTCWAGLVSWAQRTSPNTGRSLLECGSRSCREEARSHRDRACYCGKFRSPTTTQSSPDQEGHDDMARRTPKRPVHQCPGGCGAHVPHHHFACPTCWARLPIDLQTPITDNYRHDLTAHAAAMAEARQWYGQNPLQGGDR